MITTQYCQQVKIFDILEAILIFDLNDDANKHNLLKNDCLVLMSMIVIIKLIYMK